MARILSRASASVSKSEPVGWPLGAVGATAREVQEAKTAAALARARAEGLQLELDEARRGAAAEVVFASAEAAALVH